MTSKSMLALAIIALLIAAAGPLASAQTTTSTLEGKVTDSSGAVIPGASIEVKGATVTRSMTTDASGFYRAVALPAGTYSLSVNKSGFRTQVINGISLVLDRTATLDVAMEVAAHAEAVTVTGSVPLVDTTTSSTKHVIEALTIDSIPLNGRNYLDLVQLLPGVAVNENASYGSKARDTRGAILGERAGNATYLIDGLENNDDFRGGVLQSFTQDAVQEFEVITAGYKAEFGRGSGGVINVITKTGSNNWHGSGFLFARNDVLDSSNVTKEEPPPLTRYNYGFTFGGPMVKDKNWFFGSLERMQEDRGAIFPPDIPDSLRQQEDFSRVPLTRDWRLFGKYNHQLSKQNEFRAELAWSRAELRNLLASPTSLPSASTNNKTSTYFGKAGLTTIFSPRVFLDSSFGVRDQNFGQNLGQASNLGIGVLFLDDGTSYDWGPPPGSVQGLRQRYYTAREVLSMYPSSRHSTKLGFEFIRTVVDGANGDMVQSVLISTRDTWPIYGAQCFQIPQGIVFKNPGDEITTLRNNGFSFFAQDDWKVADNLTLNLGARYDYDTKFNDSNNVAGRFGLIWSPDKKTAVHASWGMFYDRYRLGVAQAVPELGGVNGSVLTEFDYPRLAADVMIPFPRSLGALAMAAGDPMFIHTRFNIPANAVVSASNIQSLTGLTPTQFLTQLTAFLDTFGTPYTPVDFSAVTGYLRQDITGSYRDQVRVANPFRTPYNNTFSVGVQRELTRDMSVGFNYVNRSIRNILGVRITNLSRESRVVGSPVTTDGLPVQRAYGPWYSGKYDAFITTFNKRMARRFSLMASYTFARSTDNLLNSNLAIGVAQQGGAAMPTDNLDLNFDRGNSDLLVPHSFVTSGSLDLPLGFRLSGVSRFTSGVYFTAAGEPFDYDGDGIHMLLAPGTKRNQFRGPATHNIDLRGEKAFTFAERYRVSVLAEVFNLTNARNPAVIDNAYIDGSPGPDFGTTRVPLPGREIQFGLRFNF